MLDRRQKTWFKHVDMTGCCSRDFVVTYPDDEEQMKQGVLKARWCVRGYLDPDLMDLQMAYPMLSQEGFAATSQGNEDRGC